KIAVVLFNLGGPDTPEAVSQTLITFQNSHDPDDLWHLVTPDYTSANVWFQLRSGDNRDMERVVRSVDDYVRLHPPPRKLDFRWAGLTYLNVVWQEKMVYGMFRSLIGSFVIVLVMMIFLFRSLLWGLLAMVPLSLTITLVYGAIGFAGKDYDMPVAVLSSLTLGLSVDFAIHFIERARELHEKGGGWRETVRLVFGDPARAISRNAWVIAVGFLPLLAAPLVPYQTVGFFLAAIMAVSALGTLLILPPLVQVLEGPLFAERPRVRLACNCWTCVGATAAAVLVAAFVLNRYSVVRWGVLTWTAAVLVILAGLACYGLSRFRGGGAADDAS
ncbi:MAG: efflux RND transporter permease subunit, partial [Nitrospinota bacterium]